MGRLFIHKNKRAYLFAFIAIELAIWLVLLHCTGGWVRFVSYSITLLSLAFAFLFLEKTADTLLTTCGLFFTCIADVFLVLLRMEGSLIAMCVFLCAQLCYAGRTYLFAKSKREKRVQLCVRGIASVLGAVATFLVVGKDTQAVFVVSVVYYVNLVCSIVFSFLHCKNDPRARLAAIGFLSFALCDISIGFDFLIDIFALGEGSFLYKFMHLGISFVNIFYPPSQVLLATSVYPSRG